ncbi:hypothetical protein E2C01_082060 [Portunus trituberculatus]|uniref:Uncharacterized protein n=1 Tax=Portunus trituberculatus TaxID=210409 RepID=A0A5B7J3Y9_PORTR|nr:hypothetical protein [Portunus trituberculatus]
MTRRRNPKKKKEANNSATDHLDQLITAQKCITSRTGSDA